MTQDVGAITPHHLQDFQANIVSHNNSVYNITERVSSFTVFESIFESSLTGSITIVDNIGLISTIPIIGQEIIVVSYKFKNKDIELVFRVSEIHDIKNVNDNTGIYALKLISDKRFKSATNLFSRAYRGKNTEIIAKIHEDFFNQQVEVISNGGSSHRIAYPYTKPYTAIDLILNNTYAEDKTPLFLYETVNSSAVKLQSYGDMLTRENNKIELKNINLINDDQTGQVTRNLTDQNQSVTEQVIKRAYKTFDNVRRGVYAAFVTSIDISGKVYSEERFDYKEHAPNISTNIRDPLSESFQINEEIPNKLFNSRQLYFEKDSLAYESPDVGNIYQVDDLSKAAMMSYRSRMDSQFVALIADSHSELEVGNMVSLNFRRMKPNLDREEDIDKVNSGEYLCTGIKHQFKAGKYSIVVEAQRFGTNKEAEY
jgi:hypothetical protein